MAAISVCKILSRIWSWGTKKAFVYYKWTVTSGLFGLLAADQIIYTVETCKCRGSLYSRCCQKIPPGDTEKIMSG